MMMSTRIGDLAVRYAVVIEHAPHNYAAYVPDLPGCVTTGATREDVERNIREAIMFHLDGLREDGLPIPEPQTTTIMVDVEPTPEPSARKV
jgi:predicted RNase H-like HicB family nuclease